MEEQELQDELASIRSLMERSSKFISLSGLSGILAGVYALIGAAVAYYIISTTRPANTYYHIIEDFEIQYKLTLLGFLVLVISIVTCIILSARQARKKNQSIWGVTSQSLLFHTGVPLFSGGVLTIVLLLHRNTDMIAPAMLVFYGIALVSASNFTFSDVKYLGLFEIALGLICACLPGYGLLFWALGFGVLHIIYGSMMYFKYDK